LPAFTLFKDRLNQGLKRFGSLPQFPNQLKFDTRRSLVFLGNRPTNRDSIKQVPAHKADLLCDNWAPVSVRAPVMLPLDQPGYDVLESPQTSVALPPFEQRANHRLGVPPPDKGHVWQTELARDHRLSKPEVRQQLDELGLDFSGVLGRSPSLTFTMQWRILLIMIFAAALAKKLGGLVAKLSRESTIIMTTLAAWVGVDQHGPCSFYIVTESLVSWPSEKGLLRWPAAEKVFACQSQPIVFGFCGSADYVPLMLSRLAVVIDHGVLLDQSTPAAEKARKLYVHLQEDLKKNPWRDAQGFQIICGIRSGDDLGAAFYLCKFQCDSPSRWSFSEIQVPPRSQFVADLGSGRSIFKGRDYWWQESQSGRTSRAVFSAFCDALQLGGDDKSGGPPQLVGLRRIGPAQHFGIIYQGRRYLSGLELSEKDKLDGVEWFNETFERCDPKTMERLPDAQPQPRPSDLKSW
jgi:hypothetical protein